MHADSARRALLTHTPPAWSRDGGGKGLGRWWAGSGRWHHPALTSRAHPAQQLTQLIPDPCPDHVAAPPPPARRTPCSATARSWLTHLDPRPAPQPCSYSPPPRPQDSQLSYSQILARAHETTRRVCALLAALAVGVAVAVGKWLEGGGGARLAARVAFGGQA